MNEGTETGDVDGSDKTLMLAEAAKLQFNRSYLRERFLYAMTQLCGRQCKINMFENTKVSGRFKAFHPSFQDIIVENLETPMPPLLKTAILRSGDIISVEFSLPNESLHTNKSVEVTEFGTNIV